MAHETRLLTALQPFFEKELITEVLHVVKSGKEATVYCCKAHPGTGVERLAAKIYRPREQRTFTNDAIYQHGRVWDPRLRRLMGSHSRKGRAARMSNWIDGEYETMHRLYAAGADLPRPLIQIGSALLMEYIGDGRGAAPPLSRVRLTPREAHPLFRRMLHNIELWLACDRIHADLSPYNVLYWQGEIRVIDFPQAVHPQVNPDAYALLAHDVAQVCRYWQGYDVRADPQRITDDLWTRYQFGGL